MKLPRCKFRQSSREYAALTVFGTLARTAQSQRARAVNLAHRSQGHLSLHNGFSLVAEMPVELVTRDRKDLKAAACKVEAGYEPIYNCSRPNQTRTSPA